jgi:hypothetical protein
MDKIAKKTIKRAKSEKIESTLPDTELQDYFSVDVRSRD